MSPEEQRQFKDFETRVRQLMMEYRRLRAANRELQGHAEKVQAELDEIKSQNLDLKRELDALRMAHMVTLEEGDLKMARAKINRMVREVDKCIALMGA